MVTEQAAEVRELKLLFKINDAPETAAYDAGEELSSIIRSDKHPQVIEERKIFVYGPIP